MSEIFSIKDVISIFNINVIENTQDQMIHEFTQLPQKTLEERHILHNRITPIHDGMQYYSLLGDLDVFILLTSLSGQITAVKANIGGLPRFPLDSQIIDSSQGLVISTVEEPELFSIIFPENRYLVIDLPQNPDPEQNGHSVIIDFGDRYHRKIIFG